MFALKHSMFSSTAVFLMGNKHSGSERAINHPIQPRWCFRSRDKRGVISLAVKHRKQPSAKPNRLHFEFRDANTTAMNFCWTFVNCILMLLSVGYMNGRQCPFSVRLMVSSSACLTHILVLVLSINATVEFHYKDLSH